MDLLLDVDGVACPDLVAQLGEELAAGLQLILPSQRPDQPRRTRPPSRTLSARYR
ncbi:hypothetical protein X773_28240 [Mesorhizobium sp. LSJC285A00]|nr:hypothetical protein X773_28240 [Mesorhizobium sp. LSJC285A00]